MKLLIQTVIHSLFIASSLSNLISFIEVWNLLMPLPSLSFSVITFLLSSLAPLVCGINHSLDSNIKSLVPLSFHYQSGKLLMWMIPANHTVCIGVLPARNLIQPMTFSFYNVFYLLFLYKLLPFQQHFHRTLETKQPKTSFNLRLLPANLKNMLVLYFSLLSSIDTGFYSFYPKYSFYFYDIIVFWFLCGLLWYLLLLIFPPWPLRFILLYTYWRLSGLCIALFYFHFTYSLHFPVDLPSPKASVTHFVLKACDSPLALLTSSLSSKLIYSLLRSTSPPGCIIASTMPQGELVTFPLHLLLCVLNVWKCYSHHHYAALR